MIFVNDVWKTAIAGKLTLDIRDAHRLKSDGFKCALLVLFSTGNCVLA